MSTTDTPHAAGIPSDTVVVVTRTAWTLTIAIGVAGNVVLCVVIGLNSFLHTAMNTYVFSIGVVDLVTCAGLLPLRIAVDTFAWNGHEPSVHVYSLELFLRTLTDVSRLLLMQSLTFERYQAIANPFGMAKAQARRRAKVVVLVQSLVSLVVAIVAVLYFCDSSLHHHCHITASNEHDNHGHDPHHDDITTTTTTTTILTTSTSNVTTNFSGTSTIFLAPRNTDEVLSPHWGLLESYIELPLTLASVVVIFCCYTFILSISRQQKKKMSVHSRGTTTTTNKKNQVHPRVSTIATLPPSVVTSTAGGGCRRKDDRGLLFVAAASKVQKEGDLQNKETPCSARENENKANSPKREVDNNIVLNHNHKKITTSLLSVDNLRQLNSLDASLDNKLYSIDNANAKTRYVSVQTKISSMVSRSGSSLSETHSYRSSNSQENRVDCTEVSVACASNLNQCTNSINDFDEHEKECYNRLFQNPNGTSRLETNFQISDKNYTVPESSNENLDTSNYSDSTFDSRLQNAEMGVDNVGTINYRKFKPQDRDITLRDKNRPIHDIENEDSGSQPCKELVTTMNNARNDFSMHTLSTSACFSPVHQRDKHLTPNALRKEHELESYSDARHSSPPSQTAETVCHGTTIDPKRSNKQKEMDGKADVSDKKNVGKNSTSQKDQSSENTSVKPNDVNCSNSSSGKEITNDPKAETEMSNNDPKVETKMTNNYPKAEREMINNYPKAEKEMTNYAKAETEMTNNDPTAETEMTNNHPPKAEQPPKSPKTIEVFQMDGSVKIKQVPKILVEGGKNVDGAICLMTKSNRVMGRRRLELQAAVKVGFLCGCFVVLWMPLPVFIAIVRLRGDPVSVSGMTTDATAVFTVMATFTAAMDTVVYGLLNSQIRQAMLAQWHKIRRCFKR